MSRPALMLTGLLLLSARTTAAPAGEPTVKIRQSGQCLPSEWAEELWPKAGSVAFAQTTLEEREVFRQVLARLLERAPSTREPPADAAAALAKIGLQLELWRTPRDTFWVLREAPDRLRGAGAYILRAGPASNDFVQAPHAYFDTNTGTLGALLFACPPEGARPRLFATNTVHRFRAHAEEERDDPAHPADVAHNPDHLFQWATDVAAQRLQNLRVFQLHGFARTQSRARSQLVAVVSDGSRRPPPTVRRLAGRLGKLLGTGVRLFPDETDILGATQNAQARLLQSYPGTSFVHLELSAEARQALVGPGEIARLGDALLAPFEG